MAVDCDGLWPSKASPSWLCIWTLLMWHKVFLALFSQLYTCGIIWPFLFFAVFYFVTVFLLMKHSQLHGSFVRAKLKTKTSSLLWLWTFVKLLFSIAVRSCSHSSLPVVWLFLFNPLSLFYIFSFPWRPVVQISHSSEITFQGHKTDDMVLWKTQTLESAPGSNLFCQ